MSIHLSIPMLGQGLTIAQAAEALAVSTRTVRRFIKSGKIDADLVPGPFGQEYRIAQLPPELRRKRPVDYLPSSPPVQTPGQSSVQFIDIIRELQDKNMALAAQLGAATERIKNLEREVRLITTTEQRSWWQKLWRRRGRVES